MSAVTADLKVRTTFGSRNDVEASTIEGTVARTGAMKPPARADDQRTVIVPTIPGWSVHLYANEPAVENVLLKVRPGAIEPESNDASLAVAVWVVESLFVHVIVPPTEIVTGFGEYAVVVNVDELATIDTGVPVLFPEGVDGELDPQPMARPIHPATIAIRSLMLFSIRSAHRKGIATLD